MKGFASFHQFVGYVALCWWLCAGIAHAQSGLEASVVVLELHLDDVGASKTVQYVSGIGERLSKQDTYATLAREDALKILRESVGSSASTAPSDVTKTIHTLLKEGEELAFTKPKRAIGVLGEVQSLVEGLGDSVVGNAAIQKDYFTSLILLARCQLFSGDEKTARATLAKVHRRFGSQYPVTTEHYHPKLVDLYERVGKEQAAKQTGALMVRTQPAGCQVYIGGRLMADEAPARFSGLYPGKVRVIAIKGDRRSTAKTVTIPAAGTAELDIDLAYESALVFHEDKFGLRFADEAALKKNLINYTAAVGALLQVDYVVLSGVVNRGGQPLLAVWQVDVKSRAIVKERALTVKENVVSNRRIEEVVDYLAASRPEPVQSEPTLKPWYTNWIGWTLVGSGVALAATAGGLGYQYAQYRDDAQAPYPDNLTPEQQDAEFDARLRAKGDAEALEAPLYIVSGLAGASIIAGIVVFAVMDVEAEDTSDSGFRYGKDIVATPVLLPGGGGVSTQIRF